MKIPRALRAAFDLPDAASRDSARACTAQVTGVAGEALVEIYELP